VERELTHYREQAGVATEPNPFIAQLRDQLEERGRAADKSFPDNRYLRFEKGEPILTPVQAAPDPDGLDQSLALIKERMEPIEILDAFADTEYWLNWTPSLRSHFRAGEQAQARLVTGICSQSSVTAAI
jgi:hypothetical protein